MNIKYIQEKLKSTFLNNDVDLAEVILTIYEHLNTKISLMIIGSDNNDFEIFNFFFNIKNNYKITNKSEYFLDILKLDNQKHFFDVIYLNGYFTSTDSIKYFTLSVPYSKKESIFIINNLSSKPVKDLSEMLKISKNFTHIIDLENTSIFIKMPNIRMISFKKLSDFSLKASGYRPDQETLDNLMQMLNSLTRIRIKDDLTIEFTSVINMDEVICEFENNEKNQIYKILINMKNGINYWFSIADRSYLNGFYLKLSKDNNIFYKKFHMVKNNKIIHE